MKKILFALTTITCFSLAASAQGNSDSVIAKNHAAFWCACIDKIPASMPLDSMQTEVENCQSLSINNLLEKKIVTQQILTDSFRQDNINRITIQLLVDNCAALQKLAAAPAPTYLEENPAAIFIPASFFAAYGMQPGETNARLRVYNMTDGKNNYHRCVDIRWVFENEKQALLWHSENLQKNSENGQLLKENIQVDGAAELAVFRESKEALETMKMFGMVQRHHYFVFVTGNVVCKVFIATDESVATKDLVTFAAAAVEQVKANQPK